MSLVNFYVRPQQEAMLKLPEWNGRFDRLARIFQRYTAALIGRTVQFTDEGSGYSDLSVSRLKYLAIPTALAAVGIYLALQKVVIATAVVFAAVSLASSVWIAYSETQQQHNRLLLDLEHADRKAGTIQTKAVTSGEVAKFAADIAAASKTWFSGSNISVAVQTMLECTTGVGPIIGELLRFDEANFVACYKSVGNALMARMTTRQSANDVLADILKVKVTDENAEHFHTFFARIARKTTCSITDLCDRVKGKPAAIAAALEGLTASKGLSKALKEGFMIADVRAVINSKQTTSATLDAIKKAIETDKDLSNYKEALLTDCVTKYAGAVKRELAADQAAAAKAKTQLKKEILAISAIDMDGAFTSERAQAFLAHSPGDQAKWTAALLNDAWLVEVINAGHLSAVLGGMQGKLESIDQDVLNGLLIGLIQKGKAEAKKVINLVEDSNLVCVRVDNRALLQALIVRDSFDVLQVRDYFRTRKDYHSDVTLLMDAAKKAGQEKPVLWSVLAGDTANYPGAKHLTAESATALYSMLPGLFKANITKRPVDLSQTKQWLGEAALFLAKGSSAGEQAAWVAFVANLDVGQKAILFDLFQASGNIDELQENHDAYKADGENLDPQVLQQKENALEHATFANQVKVAFDTKFIDYTVWKGSVGASMLPLASGYVE